MNISNCAIFVHCFRLVSNLSKLSEELNCYKVTLECKDELLPFYQRLGFCRESNNSNYLQKRFQ